jgi:hypothetical protein
MLDHTAQERYEQIAASKGIVFVLQNCWKFLAHSEMWNLRDQEAPLPKKGTQVNLDDVDGHDDNGEEEDELPLKARNNG